MAENQHAGARESDSLPKRAPGKSRGSVPGIIKALCVFAAAALVLECAGLIYGRDIFIGVIGTKRYFGLIVQQAVNPEMKSLSGALAKSASFNTWEFSADTNVNNRKDASSLRPVLGSLASDTSLNLKLGRNSSAKTVAADILLGSGGRNYLQAGCTLSSGRFVFDFPLYSDRVFFINAGDAPQMADLFHLPESAAVGTAQPNSGSLKKALGDLAGKTLGNLRNQNAYVERNRLMTFDKQKIKVDRVSLRLSQQELASTLHKALVQINTDASLAPYREQAFTALGTLLSAVAQGEGDTFSARFPYTFTNLDSALTNMRTGGATLTYYTKDSLFSQLIVGWSFTTGSGVSYTQYRCNHVDGIALKTPDGPNGAIDMKIRFTENAGYRTGTVQLLQANLAQPETLQFRYDLGHRSELGIPTGKASGYVNVSGLRYLLKLKITNSGAKSVAAMDFSHSDVEVLKTTYTLNATKDVLSGPTAGAGSVDAVKDSAAVLPVLVRALSELAESR